MSFSVATSQQHYVVFSATVVLAQYAFVQHMEKVLIGLKAEHVMIVREYSRNKVHVIFPSACTGVRSWQAGWSLVMLWTMYMHA